MNDEDPLASPERLIESAMGNVKVIECPMCEGRGKIKKALEIECPRCDGSGKTTQSDTTLGRYDHYA